MHALRDQRWWIITGVSVALLGNLLVAVLWCWTVFSTPVGTHARYIIEAGLSFAHCCRHARACIAVHCRWRVASRHARSSARDVCSCSRAVPIRRCAHADPRHAPSDYPVAIMRPNQAMQRTASKAATGGLCACHLRLGCAAGCGGLAVADLVSR
jgi:hypothetical protein